MKVLVVDDDLAVADVLASMLEDLGCEVETRDGPQPAIAWPAEPPLPDLVISDIRMPGSQNGIDLARHIKSNYPDMPVVLVTGYSEYHTGDLKVPVLLKPITHSALEGLIESIRNHSV